MNAGQPAMAHPLGAYRFTLTPSHGLRQAHCGAPAHAAEHRWTLAANVSNTERTEPVFDGVVGHTFAKW
jgi:hypothetical protein